GVLTALVLAGVGLYLKGEAVQVVTDSETLCPEARHIREVVVLLLDMSDQFSEPQRLEIKNKLARIRDKVARFGLIEVYVVGQIGQEVITPVFHLCNPGTGADLNRLYQNPDLARRKWEDFR